MALRAGRSPATYGITDSRRTLPRRDAMTSPHQSGRPRASRRRYEDPSAGYDGPSGRILSGPAVGGKTSGVTGGDDERQLQEAGHRAAALLGMTETADTQRVQIQLPDLEITLPARAENVAVVRHAVGGLGEVLEVDDQTLSDIKLAVTEACTNVVRHAYEEGEGTIDVVVRPRAEGFEVVISDEGRGMGTSPDSEGPGLGLPLISALADSVELGPGRHGGSRLAMTFPIGRA